MKTILVRHNEDGTVTVLLDGEVLMIYARIDTAKIYAFNYAVQNDEHEYKFAYASLYQEPYED